MIKQKLKKIFWKKVQRKDNFNFVIFKTLIEDIEFLNIHFEIVENIYISNFVIIFFIVLTSFNSIDLIYFNNIIFYPTFLFLYYLLILRQRKYRIVLEFWSTSISQDRTVILRGRINWQSQIYISIITFCSVTVFFYAY